MWTLGSDEARRIFHLKKEQGRSCLWRVMYRASGRGETTTMVADSLSLGAAVFVSVE